MNSPSTIKINGREIEFQKGKTILEICREAGITVPTLCHDDRLKPYGGCRLCIVEIKGMPVPLLPAPLRPRPAWRSPRKAPA